MKTPRINFGDHVALKVTTPEPVPELVKEEPIPEGPRKVQLSTRVTEDIYIALHQVKYWGHGVVLEDYINEALSVYISQTPGGDKPLPPMELAKLKQKKKLRS
jgi:hypothetical protein